MPRRFYEILLLIIGIAIVLVAAFWISVSLLPQNTSQNDAIPVTSNSSVDSQQFQRSFDPGLDLEHEATTEQLGNLPIPTPGNLRAQRLDSTVTFSWTHPWKGGPQYSPIFSHYNVYRAINGSPLELIGTTTDNVFTDSLNPSLTATYAVSVVTIANEEGGISKPVLEERDETPQ